MIAASATQNSFEKVAIVVVTFRRQELLRGLLSSIGQLSIVPWRVVVVDNENSDETHRICDHAAQAWKKQGGPWEACELDYVPQEENTGGAGGFSAGVKRAYELGAAWFWLMDDDVSVMPDALEKLRAWAQHYEAVQGSRLDVDGGPFYWQYRFWAKLGIYNPFASADLGKEGFRKANALCFEGGLFNRRIVERIGLPDYRFFLYWDDCVYGYLASKITEVVVVKDVVLQRRREVPAWEMAAKRQLNSASDMTRFCIMRNRGHMAHYLKMNGDYMPPLFALGTLASFAKELVRLIAVDRKSFRSGMGRLIAGWREARRIIHDKTWQPMPPLSRDYDRSE